MDPVAKYKKKIKNPHPGTHIVSRAQLCLRIKAFYCAYYVSAWMWIIFYLFIYIYIVFCNGIHFSIFIMLYNLYNYFFIILNYFMNYKYIININILSYKNII